MLGAMAQTPVLKYTNAHDDWNADSLGTHRVIVNVTSKGDVAKVIIPWRRRDENPQNKDVILVDAQTCSVVKNALLKDVSREQGTIYFEPTSGVGRYYVYYMPYHIKGVYYPKTIYLPVKNTADENWLAKTTKSTLQAVCSELQSVNGFNNFYPMEVIATQKETDDLIKKNSDKSYLVFPEDRLHSIKMTNDLPFRWIKKGVQNSFKDEALRGENFAYQLGIYPAKKDLKNVRVEFSDLKSASGAVLSKSIMQCINNEGVNWIGTPETFMVNVPQKKVQALWCTIDIPEDTKAGVYAGAVKVSVDNAPTTTVKISLKINDQIAKDHGVDEPWKQTRLTWLNSTLYEKNTVIAPYIPLKKSGNEISLLGRKVTIAKTGFPAQLQSFFTQEMTSISNQPKDVLTEPIHFHFTKSDGKDIAFNSSLVDYTEQSEGTISWQVKNTSPEIEMDVNGSLEFDGFINYTVKVIALQDADFNNINLHIPFQPSVAKYILGLGNIGQKRPDSIAWKWHVDTLNQDGAWLGDVNAGLQFSLRDQHYVRPLNTNFYLQKPLLLPSSWGNDNKGGISIWQKGKAILVDNYSGARSMKKGDTLYYNFRMLFTPFHTLDTKSHFANRYIHKYINTDTAKALGATVINIHQGTAINPYINYPFIKTSEMKSYIDSAHALGEKVKIYNTVRELSNRAYELPALFSLGTEIFSPGKGNGYPWLCEHLDTNYIAGWYTPEANDAAIVQNGMSRWHNYYVEGTKWLVKNVGIDGLYLDDVAFDRDIMKRVKRALLQDNHPGLIDLHSANQFDKADGWNNSSILYMELFPYLNRLWFGEKFDYENNSKDYYLTEMSGIPFGLMGEMLENNGNAWRGMLYGMTDRLLWFDNADPRPLWKVWDSFGIGDAKMIGYWVDDNPVKSDNEDVPVTIYKKNNSVLISLASWAKNDVNIHLKIDWKALGINPSTATIVAPVIDKFQPARAFKIDEAIHVEKNKGWLLIVK
ncbi:hypothetical protein A9P82_09050 [Arachidicoccus ginsenosidimutans]|nr:hypothetical protein A9P82_09050 [Arachidicoccus sp. BS20]